MFNPSLTLVEDIDEAYKFLAWLKQPREVLGIDTETTGLDWWTPHFTRTVQFGDPESAYTLPLNWWYKVIKEAVETYTHRTVMHNAKFDIHALQSAEIAPNIAQIDDTKIMASIIDPMANNSLKVIARKYVDPNVDDGQAILRQAMNKNGWTWATVPVDFEGYWAYAALDTAITAALYSKLAIRIEKENLEQVYEMELQTNHILREAESRGARVDLTYTHNLKMDWDHQMHELQKEIGALGVENPNANRQIEAALRLEGWEPEDFTAKGNVRLDEGVLKGLDYPVVQKILDYKKLKKWTTAYLHQFITQADGDKLHADIHTLAAITGRMSITKPALQTLPRGPEIRNCIMASEGRHLLAIDYSQIEYRLFAHFSGEEKMIEAMRKPETDFHSATAEIIFGKDYTSQQRSLSKNCNFAWLYGAGPARLAKTANKDAEVLTELQAKEILDQYRITFPGAAQFMQEVERVAKERQLHEGRPYIFTPSGRKLFAEKDKYYTLVNFLCQGTAAEVLKEKIVALDMAGLTRYLILPVHDELIFDIPDDEWESERDKIIPIMQDLTSFRVPLTISVSDPLERWGQNAK